MRVRSTPAKMPDAVFAAWRARVEAALDRVLRDPAPSVALSAFGADGLEFTVGFWIADPENGQMGLRSQVNLAILRSLRAHGIDIPYPQRVVHWQPAAGSDAAAPLPLGDSPSATSPARPL